MSPHPETNARRGRLRDPIAVRVDRNRRGKPEVYVPGRREVLTRATLDDASQVAYLCTAHRRPCELIVCDAHHRVLCYEFTTDHVAEDTEERER